MLSGFLPTGIQTHAHTHTHTRIKPSKCVWSMPTQPDSRICIISCSADLIDCRIKWSLKESFMSFFCFLFSPAHTQSFFWNSFARRGICPWMCIAVILVLILKLWTGTCSMRSLIPAVYYAVFHALFVRRWYSSLKHTGFAELSTMHFVSYHQSVHHRDCIPPFSFFCYGQRQLNPV